jgi:Cro/C1-type HTH DNA-binding domain
MSQPITPVSDGKTPAATGEAATGETTAPAGETTSPIAEDLPNRKDDWEDRRQRIARDLTALLERHKVTPFSLERMTKNKERPLYAATIHRIRQAQARSIADVTTLQKICDYLGEPLDKAFPGLGYVEDVYRRLEDELGEPTVIAIRALGTIPLEKRNMLAGMILAWVDRFALEKPKKK